MRSFPLLVSLLAAGSMSSAGPSPATLPRSTPEAQGISSAAILAFVEEAEQKLDALHSFMLVRHGHVLAEGWWAPYAAGEPHQMFSLSKSFTSTAVGLAIAEGKLQLDDPVLQFFPDLAPDEPSANLKAMRIRDLLTMTAGHHEEDIRGFPYRGEDEDPVRKFFSLPVAHKPGTFFVYNTPASYMLSAIVQKVTGQSILDYLRPRLFEPLGIADPAWEASRQGVSMGGFGLSIRTEDLARFGQLYLQKGMWQGKQLVPAAWVETATARQVSNGSSPSSDWEQGYGFQFWRSRHGFYRGDGAHGQFCLILPQYDAVVAITSGTRDMGSVMNLVWDRLVPALKADSLPADSAAHGKLTSRLGSLMLRPLAGTAAPATAQRLRGRRYLFDKNPQRFESLALQSTGEHGDTSFAMQIAGSEERVVAGSGTWKKGTVTLGGTPEPIAASGGWTSADTYRLKIIRYHTPFSTTLDLRFAGDRLFVKSENNVGPAESRVSEFIGKVEKPSTSSQ